MNASGHAHHKEIYSMFQREIWAKSETPPPLRNRAGIKTHGGAYESARDDVGLRLAVNRDRVDMEDPGDLASSKSPAVGAEDLRDHCCT
jgi:hypothetical protein